MNHKDKMTRLTQNEEKQLKEIAVELKEGIKRGDKPGILKAAKTFAKKEKKYGFITKPAPYRDLHAPRMTEDIKALLKEENARRPKTVISELIKIAKAILNIIGQRLAGITKPLLPLEIATALTETPQKEKTKVEAGLGARIKSLGEDLFSGPTSELLGKPRPELVEAAALNALETEHPNRQLASAARIHKNREHPSLEHKVADLETARKECKDFALLVEKKKGKNKGDNGPSGP